VANPGFSVAAVLMPTITLSPKALTGQRSLGTLLQDIPAFAPRRPWPFFTATPSAA
jgi:hypothetical protein